MYNAVASALRSGQRGQWAKSNHPDHCFNYYRYSFGSSSDNFATS